MDKDILAILKLDETKSFSIIKPFHGSLVSHMPSLSILATTHEPQRSVEENSSIRITQSFVLVKIFKPALSIYK